MRYLDMENWNRIEHFNFFSSFDEPFFSLVANVECTNTLTYSKENKVSFFALYLHKSLQAVNNIEEFRYRIKDDKVVIMDSVHASPTIGREDGTFGAAFIPYSEDINAFISDLDNEKDAVFNSTGIRLQENQKRLDVIHYSSILWVSFTDLTHPRSYNTGDSIPKISFGKVIENNGKHLMPVSVLAHHGLMDGIHMGKFFEEFEKRMMYDM